MNFTKISEDTNCDCIKDTENDNESHFVRKLNKDFLIEKDILSHWERGIGQESKAQIVKRFVLIRGCPSTK